jgi:hypothetical protein
MKLLDIHLGAEGDGLWLRYTDENEEGIPLEYEGCSLPDDPCTRRISQKEAAVYLSMGRTADKASSVCGNHWHARARLKKVERARLLKELSAQPQNDNGQKSPEEKVRERRAAVVKDLLDKITNEVLRRKGTGEAIENVKADEVARELSIGGTTGGNVMMQKLKYNGYSTTWLVLRRAIWDGGGEWRGNSTKT